MTNLNDFFPDISSDPVSWLPSILFCMKTGEGNNFSRIAHGIVSIASSPTGVETSLSKMELNELKSISKNIQKVNTSRKYKNKVAPRQTAKRSFLQFFEGKSLELLVRLFLLSLEQIDPPLIPFSLKTQLLVLERNRTLTKKSLQAIVNKLEPRRTFLLSQFCEILVQGLDNDDLHSCAIQFVFLDVKNRAEKNDLAKVFYELTKESNQILNPENSAYDLKPSNRKKRTPKNRAIRSAAVATSNSEKKNLRFQLSKNNSGEISFIANNELFNIERPDREIASPRGNSSQRKSKNHKTRQKKQHNTFKSGKEKKTKSKHRSRASRQRNEQGQSLEPAPASRQEVRAKLKNALRFFFKLRDSDSADIVEALFMYYSFQDIIKGVLEKYRILPIGWKEIIESNADLTAIVGPNPAYLDETTISLPRIRPTSPNFGPWDDPLDYTVDEFISLEKKYSDTLSTFTSCYVEEIMAIARNRVGFEAQNALGLTLGQAEKLFGKPLYSILRASKAFVTLLDVLSFTDGAVHSKIVGGRVSILMEIVTKCSETLIRVYTDYLAHYKRYSSLLQDCEAGLPTVYIKNPNIPAQAQHLNFLQIYQQLSNSKEAIKGKSIDSVLNLPVKQFPTYKLLLERLIKDGSKEERRAKNLPIPHPSRDKVQKTLASLITQINKMDNSI
eukprot:maker-scaffold_73-snap-gene-0.4-mRNA-1 protein AED:0.03 eAED:0.03 QI:0/0.66/0.5/1/1/1/4/178/670